MIAGGGLISHPILAPLPAVHRTVGQAID